MSKKTSKKSAAAAAPQGESFFDATANAGSVPPTGAVSPEALKAGTAEGKRTYKPRALTGKKAPVNAMQDAFQLGFKEGLRIAALAARVGH